MSLYALLPGAPLSLPSIKNSLYQPVQAANDFAKDMAKQSHTHNEGANRRVVLEFSKIVLETTCLASACPPKRQVSRTNSLSTADETLSSSMSMGTESVVRHDQHLKIRVQEVKINFLKLARPNSHSCKTGTLRSLCRSKRDARLRRRKRQASANNLTSYENAVEFDLVIQFAGRKYTTKRTLSQIALLRCDLLEDLEFAERLPQKRTWSDDSSLDSANSSNSCSSAIGIPPLPRMSEAGVFGGGFAQMSGLMQAYRPGLEGWFNTLVAAVSEDSPILADFLWEPLSGQDRNALHASLTQLGSIQEHC